MLKKSTMFNALLKSSEKKKRFLLLLGALLFFNLFVFGTFYFAVKNNNSLSKIASKANEVSGILPTPTPFPFQEYTIPYLRLKNYESTLNDRKLAYEKGNYTVYLTSYTSDGLRINGLLTVPAGTKPVGGWPAIVFIHGYISPSQYQTLENYSAYVDYLSKNGFVVFKIDLRGHADSEGEAGGAYYSSDYITDVLNARSALQNSDFVDPGKIGLWGHSMAGNVVMRTLAANPSIPAVVIWAGAVYTYEDFQEFGIGDNSYRPPSELSESRKRRNKLFETYGQFNAKSEFWKLVPATNYLSDIKGAVSLNHAVDDTVVNIGYSRNLNSLLDKTSIEHELNEYPSGGHNISGVNFNQAMQNTVEFFKKYLE